MIPKLINYELPEVITIEALSDMYQKVKGVQFDGFNIDWPKCTGIYPDAACVLRCMLKTDVLMRASLTGDDSSEVFEGFQELMMYRTDEINLSESNLGFFLSSANDERIIVSRKVMMENYLRSHSMLSNYDLTGVEQIFSELFMNVCQHSGFHQGLVYIPDFTGSKHLSIIVVDLGKGIPANIKLCFPEYETRSDEDAIEFATNDWITTKSTPQNYGRGLAHLLSISDSIGGEVVIVSGAGKLIRTNSESHKYKFDGFFPGTLVHAKLDLCNFELREQHAFNEDIDF